MEVLFVANKIVVLGGVHSNPSLGTSCERQITLADLTGVAVQDIQIVKAILKEAH